MSKLAIVASHPIQYYAPLFRTLAKEIELKVFYCHNPNAEEIGRDGFGGKFDWDVDLMSGYDHEFLLNRSKNPSLSKYHGCDTPQIGEAIHYYRASHVVIFGWYLKSFVQALKYCNKKKIPVAVRGDSILNPTLPIWKKLLKRFYYPTFLEKYDSFLYVGKRNKEYLKYYGVPESNLIFSPHAVDQEFWHVEPSEDSNSGFTFIWVGKFIEIKQPESVLKTFLETFGNSERVQLKMIGTGPLHSELEKKYSSSNIIFSGFKNQKELLKEYNNSDCLILSSSSETWGLVVNEAMACGLPAIVSNACGCAKDLIEEGKTGYTYKYADTNILKKKMEIAVQKNKWEYFSHLNKKNELYSYRRNIQSFQEFISLSKK